MLQDAWQVFFEMLALNIEIDCTFRFGAVELLVKTSADRAAVHQVLHVDLETD
jgi:hypothetical protein